MKELVKKGIVTLACPRCGSSELVFADDISDYEYLCAECGEYFDDAYYIVKETGVIEVEVDE